MQPYNPRPVAFVVVSTDHGMMLANRHDYHVTAAGRYGVSDQLFHQSSYDQGEVDLALHLINLRRKTRGDGIVAIDCGANIGVHTIEWAHYMHGWGQVIAFEAQERLFYALAGNITINNCFNARAVWAAVGATAGIIKVPVPDYFAPSSFGSLELRPTGQTEFIGQTIDYSHDKCVDVRMTAIDDLALPRLDFLKIDVEGMETEVLAGAINSIEKHHPHVLVEKVKSDEAAITTFFEQRGYKLFPLGLNFAAMHQDEVSAQSSA